MSQRIMHHWRLRQAAQQQRAAPGLNPGSIVALGTNECHMLCAWMVQSQIQFTQWRAMLQARAVDCACQGCTSTARLADNQDVAITCCRLARLVEQGLPGHSQANQHLKGWCAALLKRQPR